MVDRESISNDGETKPFRFFLLINRQNLEFHPYSPGFPPGSGGNGTCVTVSWGGRRWAEIAV